MDHRTHGETRNCKGCRYWSEMVAQSSGGGPVQALCLSQTSTDPGPYMAPGRTCTEWASGHLGAIDEPGQDPNVYENEVTS